MKKLALTVMLLSSTLVPCRAQLFGPEAWSGALFGTFFGGLAGADCHHGFSGTGAAIGAGVGFTLGAIAGEANRRASYPYGAPYNGSVVYAQPGYGYAYVTTPNFPPPPHVVPSAKVVASAKPAPKPAKKSVSAARPPSAIVQIPDAPRVPDAPSF
jgi:predicted lipid-binding transport protein (Tim44 family)